MFARPILGGFDEPRARTEAALALGDDEAIQFRARADFKKVVDADVSPADNPCIRRFRHKQRVLRGGLQCVESFCDLRTRRRITKLAVQLRQLRCVADSRATNFYILIRFLGHFSACFLS